MGVGLESVSWCNGNTSVFGAEFPGSNPGETTLFSSPDLPALVQVRIFLFLTMDYNRRNAHRRDRCIEFDAASHTYTAICPDGLRLPCDSVTTVVEGLFDKFDAEYWAARKATPKHPAEVIIKEWEAKGKEARDLGTLMHDRIERHYLSELIENEAFEDPAFRNFLTFSKRIQLTPYRSEWRIFSEKYRIAGTLDFLAFDGRNFEIYDWKRSNKIVDKSGKPITENRFGRHAHDPISDVPDTTFQHYALQLSLYRYILETEYNIQPVACHLGNFHPDYSEPYVVDVPYLRTQVVRILNSRL